MDETEAPSPGAYAEMVRRLGWTEPRPPSPEEVARIRRIDRLFAAWTPPEYPYRIRGDDEKWKLERAAPRRPHHDEDEAITTTWRSIGKYNGYRTFDEARTRLLELLAVKEESTYFTPDGTMKP